jgi:basic amino acid/polyamine antiporter, APA family
VFVLRRTRPDAVRPYRALGYPIIPALFVIAAILGIISAYVAATKTSLLGTGILLAGVVAYYWAKRQAA